MSKSAHNEVLFHSGRSRAIAEHRYFKLCEKIRKYNDLITENPSDDPFMHIVRGMLKKDLWAEILKEAGAS